MTSVANMREAPYLKSSHVIGWPSSHLTPSLTVNDQTLPPSDEVPVSVARSATGVLATSRVGRRSGTSPGCGRPSG